MAVVGAGASGAEIASAYARLGIEVMLFEALDRVLPTEDADISKLAERGLKKQGIDVHTGTLVENVETSDDSVHLHLRRRRGEADWLVIAAGRGPDVEGLGLDEAGVELDEHGLIEVDGALRTTPKGVYAIGDLVPGPALAHKASDEGIIAVEDAAGLETHPIEYVDIPRATFCTPERRAPSGSPRSRRARQGHDVVVGKVQYGAVGAGTVYGDRTGLIKIVGDKKYGELLGGHIVGAKATELIQELVNAKLLEGGYPEVARIIHGHPTLSRGRHGGRARRRRLADPRLTRRPARLLLRPRLAGGYLAAERVLHDAARASSGSRCSPATCPAPRLGGVPLRRGARHRAARRSSAAPPSRACSRCAGPTRSRSTASSRCAPRPTPSRSAARSRSRWPRSARPSRAGARSPSPTTS